MTDTSTRQRRLYASHVLNGSRPRVMRYAHLVGWGMEVPLQVLSNSDLEAIVETDDEWITTRTGIKERRIAEQHETTTTLATRAAQKALDVADVLPSEIDLIIVATATPEYIFPSTASMVQDLLGASNAGAFDLSAACSGFVYGLDVATSKIRCGSINTALVIGAETLSRVVDWTDRGTCILFGDGAGAVVLQGSDTPGGVLSTELRSDGSGWDMLTLPTVSSRDTYLQDGSHQMHRIYMDGKGVYRFATRIIGDSIKNALEKVGLTPDQINLVIPHQANQRIIDYAAKALKIPEDRVYSNVAKYGNTSAASIPIALAEAAAAGRIRPGDIVAMVGFGGGLTWATAIIEWSALPGRPQYSMTGVRRQGEYALAGLRRPIVRWWRRAMLLSPGSLMGYVRRWLINFRNPNPVPPGNDDESSGK
ncbi:MAG TPA: beta-ketoacyl-ACP synthase III [Aggregatilinea sp.]|uniref:beta-ketoacyl-ACP synthase III n=1 Tax=Aggregatilinea sp. TaxID=2806333 RepID=UPI002B981FCC|nr:beta-ketoacyl-ACP synthase III [Aggregatilinea sp.]HML21692.1 beta-ketoacyl-ACP synthase III [Aggregatilinea sp.]